MNRSPSNASAAREDLRPRLALRIGVTGHRDIATRYPEAAAELSGTLTRLLGAIAAAVARVAGSAAAREAYSEAPPLLRILSALAEGADRLLAEAATPLGYRLSAVLPFPESVYEEDFDEASRGAFRALLSRAHAEEGVVVLDGERGGYVGEHSYEAAGRFIVRNCDILIAVWEYGRRSGLGGTADTIDYALSYELPVIWIPADRPSRPRLLDARFALVVKPPPAAALEGAIGERIAALLSLPDWRTRPQRQGARVLQWWRRLPYRKGSPYRQFLAEGLPEVRGLAASYRTFLRLFAVPGAAAAAQWVEPEGLPAGARASFAAFRRIAERCDRLAVYYAACHRSSFLGVYLLGALALSLAILGIASAALETAGTMGGLACLLVIAVLVFSDRVRRWHDRWIDYRSIAETLRQTAHLTLLGRALPVRTVLQLTRQPAPATRPPDWIAWYLQALLRQIPPAAVRYDPLYLDVVRKAFLDRMIDGQTAYYSQTGETARRVSEFLAVVGLLLFTLTVILGLFELMLAWASGAPALVHWAALCAAILPVVSVAVIGLRAQAEFEVIGSGSVRLVERLRQSERQLRRLDLAGPLASERLAGGMFAISRLMLGEIEDWALLFDVKLVKLG
jgi:hypothetical protein